MAKLTGVKQPHVMFMHSLSQKCRNTIRMASLSFLLDETSAGNIWWHAHSAVWQSTIAIDRRTYLWHCHLEHLSVWPGFPHTMAVWDQYVMPLKDQTLPCLNILAQIPRKIRWDISQWRPAKKHNTRLYQGHFPHGIILRRRKKGCLRKKID